MSDGKGASAPSAPRSGDPKEKFGIAKPSIQYVPPTAVLQEAVVMALGAKKYGPFNWREGSVNASTYYSAAFRHLAAWFDGEDIDPESGAHHLAHVRASMGILLDALAHGTLIDDRPPAQKPIAKLTDAEFREAISAGRTPIHQESPPRVDPRQFAPVERPRL